MKKPMNRRARKRAEKAERQGFTPGCDAPRRGGPVPGTGKVPASSSRRGGR